MVINTFTVTVALNHEKITNDLEPILKINTFISQY